MVGVCEMEKKPHCVAWTCLALDYTLQLLIEFQREHASYCLPVCWNQPHELILFLNDLLWTKHMFIKICLGIKEYSIWSRNSFAFRSLQKFIAITICLIKQLLSFIELTWELNSLYAFSLPFWGMPSVAPLAWWLHI